MNATLIIMPGSPALVPHLAPADTVGAHLLAQVRHLLDQELQGNDRPIALVSSRAQDWFTAHTGSLRAWGAPEVQVSAGNYLAEIVQRFALGEYENRVISVRDRLEEINPEALTLLALDGPTGLTQRAPSALVPGALEADQWCRDVLAGTTSEIPTASSLIDASLREPQLWLDLASTSTRCAEAVLLESDLSFGVGRYVARWNIH